VLYRFSEFMPRIFKYSNIQNISLTPDKELNMLIYWTPIYVIIYMNCPLLNMGQFFDPPSISRYTLRWHRLTCDSFFCINNLLFPCFKAKSRVNIHVLILMLILFVFHDKLRFGILLPKGAYFSVFYSVCVSSQLAIKLACRTVGDRCFRLRFNEPFSWQQLSLRPKCAVCVPSELIYTGVFYEMNDDCKKWWFGEDIGLSRRDTNTCAVIIITDGQERLPRSIVNLHITRHVVFLSAAVAVERKPLHQLML